MSIELKIDKSEAISLPHDHTRYLITVWVVAIIIRFAMSFLRTVQHRYSTGQTLPSETKSGFFRSLFGDISGFHKSEPQRDFLYPAILGLLELLVFPILIWNSHWEAVGGWIGFKALAQWELWSKDRNAYNRFLIGNALVAVSAGWLAYFCQFFH